MPWFNRHKRLRDQLSTYIDGELSASAAERMDAHLAACDSCRAELEQLRATVAALRDLPQAEAPRSFALAPEQAASGRPLIQSAPFALGMRVAAAGIAVALAAVLMVDLGNFGGGGVTEDGSAPQMLSDRMADKEGLEAGAAAPAAGEDAEIADDDTSSMFDAGRTEEPPPAEGGLETTRTTPSPAPTLPPDATVVPRGSDGDTVTRGLTPQPEAGIIETDSAAQGGGGIDTLTVIEIALAGVLGLLVAGGLIVAFVGKRR